MTQTARAPFSTCDLKIAAYLIHSGFEVRRWVKSGERVFFDFDATPAQEQAVMSFVNKKTNVEPLAFMESMSRARDLVTLAKKS